MTYTEITVSRSIQVLIHPGFPEQWIKGEIKARLQETDNLADSFSKAYDDLGVSMLSEINKIDANKPPVKSNSTMYFNVSKNKNENG